MMIRVYEDEDITKYYAEFRPKFQDCVVDAVMRFYNENKSQDGVEQVMVDVACGSGQATTAFRRHFSQIIGVDVSPNQIKQARKANVFNHISYEVGTAEKLPFGNASIDLITSAAACHRFDLPRFFQEAKRVLKPDGVVALIGYNAPKLTPLETKSGEVVEELSRKVTSLLDEYEQHPNDQRSNDRLECRYKNVYDALPAEKKLWITDGLLMEFEWNLVQLLGYYRSLAAYHEYVKMKKGDGVRDTCDRAEFLRKFVKSEWGMEKREDTDVKMKVEFCVYAVLGSKLKPCVLG